MLSSRFKNVPRRTFYKDKTKSLASKFGREAFKLFYVEHCVLKNQALSSCQIPKNHFRT